MKLNREENIKQFSDLAILTYERTKDEFVRHFPKTPDENLAEFKYKFVATVVLSTIQTLIKVSIMSLEVQFSDIDVNFHIDPEDIKEVIINVITRMDLEDLWNTIYGKKGDHS